MQRSIARAGCRGRTQEHLRFRRQIALHRTNRALVHNPAQAESNNALFQIARLDPRHAGIPPGVTVFGDAGIISTACSSPRKRTSYGTPDFLSHDTDRWAHHLLQRGRTERRADASPSARTSLIIADVRTFIRPAFRSLSP